MFLIMNDLGGEKRKPILALLGAVVSPGLGHLYSGRPIAAVGWLFVQLVIFHFWFDVLLNWDNAPLNIILLAAAILFVHPIQIIHAIVAAVRQPADYRKRWYNSWKYYVAWWLLVAVIGVVAAPDLSGYRAFHIPTASMENAIMPGDYLLADVGIYDQADPERGDIVVFIFPGDGQTKYVERCVGLPGDTIEIIDKQVFINGEPERAPATVKHIDTTISGEQVIQARREGGKNSRDNFGPYVIPDGTFFMLGDNRDNSYDSRFWRSVPRELLIGKPKRIYMSADTDRIGMAVQ